jgi:uncharacterized protein
MTADRPYALVTGASSGLGTEFARLLAERNYNLVLHGRRRERLEELSGELTRKHGIISHIVTADLAQPNGATELIAAVEIHNLQIEMLINNAGFGVFGPFLEQTEAQIQQMIAVNLASCTTLIRHFSAKMAARKRGSILQVASYAGVQSLPWYSVYSATKAYGIMLIESLRHEFRKLGIKASVIAPGFFDSEFHVTAKHKQNKWMRMLNIPVRKVAEAGLRGVERNKLLITPGWIYRTNNVVARFLPKRWLSAVSAAIIKG